MTDYQESLRELAEDFEIYLQKHKDNSVLDLTELDITTDQIDWLIDEIIKRKIINTRTLINCKNCKFFNEDDECSSFDTCAKGWECAIYYNKPIEWELR